MDVKQLIGQRIKEIRTDKGMTQENLAELVGINSKYLSSIERGKENPTLNTIVKLAKSLNVSPNEIFKGTDIKDPKKQKDRIKALINQANDDQLDDIYSFLSLIIK